MSRTLDFTRNRDHMSHGALKRELHGYARELYQRLLHSPHKRLMASLDVDPTLLYDVRINPDQSITLSIGSHTFDPPIQSVTCSSLFAALFLASVPGGFVSEQCPIASWRDDLPQGEPPSPLFPSRER